MLKKNIVKVLEKISVDLLWEVMADKDIEDKTVLKLKNIRDRIGNLIGDINNAKNNK